MLPKSYDKRFKRFINLKYLKLMTLNNRKYMIDKNIFNFKDLKSFKIMEANKFTKEMENGSTFIR